jgi:hypothetical protein
VIASTLSTRLGRSEMGEECEGLYSPPTELVDSALLGREGEGGTPNPGIARSLSRESDRKPTRTTGTRLLPLG